MTSRKRLVPLAKQQQPGGQISTATQQLDIDPKTEAVFRRKNYHILNKLGAGAFGTVYKAERICNSQELCAVKVLDLTKMSSNYRSKFLPRELQALIETRHENIVDVFDIIRSNKRIYIFMEFMGGGDIASYVRKNVVSMKLACIWFLQVANGLAHLHEQLYMCHRDIKLDNMLLNDANIAKLSDFGFAKTLMDSNSSSKVILSQTFCGTLPYYCPQLLQKIPYDAFKADTWAMGVSFYILLENRFPFHYKDKATMLEETVNYPYYIRKRFRETPNEARKLIESMLNPNEKERYSIMDVLRNRWLSRFWLPSSS